MVHTPNPRRVEAGRLNRAKRKGLTPEGREKLRRPALENKPWKSSTGPRTPEGKAKIAASKKARQKGPPGITAIRAELADYRGFMKEMREARAMGPRLKLQSK
jgi:hypothetical protein